MEVTDVQQLMEVEVEGKQLGDRCVHRSEGVDWLHTANTLRQIQGHDIIGPAGQFFGGLTEHVPALVCSDPNPDVDWNYLHRVRHGWPSTEQLKTTMQFPMLNVLVGHKLSQPDQIPLQARSSWSPSEMVLIRDLPDDIKQVYIAIKYTFKHLMKRVHGSSRVPQGRSTVGSYHLKTVFLYLLERRLPTKFNSPLDLMLDLLHDLNGYLEVGKLPHYFLPDCNLLVTVGLEERCIARDVIQHMRSDPLCAILTCPTSPHVIYGKVPLETLVDAFCEVSSHPTCIRSQEHLLCLLRCLDEKRWKLYLEQQEMDGMGRVSRPMPLGLVDMLQTHYVNLGLAGCKFWS